MPYFPPPATGSGYSTVEDEGIAQTQRSTIDFVGTGVTASDTGSKTQVSISSGAVAVSAASLSFTNGDTFKRFTVTDAAVTSTSKIVGTITRPNVADSDDPGWTYLHTVVSRATGSFDLLVAVFDWNDPAGVSRPNETVTFSYVLGT